MKFLPSLRSGCAVTDHSIRGVNRSFGVATVVLLGSLASSTLHAGVVGRQRVASGLSAPMFTAFAPGDPTRLFIGERGSGSETNATATIRVLNLTTGVLEPTPFLTITGVHTQSEGGLLGMAFHPDYQNNHKFYVNVTAADSDPNTPFSTYIREYTAPSATANVANPTPKAVMSWTQPQPNHNGGWIGFGPNDGYLYIMSGDGGGSFDNESGHTAGIGNAQDTTNNFLGKTLRIDVDRDDFAGDAARNYGIPFNTSQSPGNPFAPDTPGATNPNGDDEIWAYGLRNPFRAGFDRATGDLWMGDVGQGAREEVNFQPGNSVGGENYGWRLREGTIPTQGGGVGGAPPTGAIEPIYDYRRLGTTGVDANFTGNVVIGGIPYRGPDPELQGLYFFADQSASKHWTLRRATETTPQEVRFINSEIPVNTGSASSPVNIGEDANGNLYVTYLSGSVYRIVTDALTPGDFNADAKVDDADLAVWKTGFGTTTGATAATGDADGDGDVDGADFLSWQRNFGWSALNVGGGAPAASVPEPTAAALAGIAAMGLVLGRRQRG